jgi:hypothetical protein
MAKMLTVRQLADYLRGLTDAGGGDALVGAREEDDNETMQWVTGSFFAANDGNAETGGRGILWLYLEDL